MRPGSSLSSSQRIDAFQWIVHRHHILKVGVIKLLVEAFLLQVVVQYPFARLRYHVDEPVLIALDARDVLRIREHQREQVALHRSLVRPLRLRGYPLRAFRGQQPAREGKDDQRADEQRDVKPFHGGPSLTNLRFAIHTHATPAKNAMPP